MVNSHWVIHGQKCRKCGEVLRRTNLGGIYCKKCNEYKTIDGEKANEIQRT